MKKYPFVQQLEHNDCGAACVSMIIQKITKNILSIGECSKLICTTENGSGFLDIKHGLAIIGIKGHVYKCNESELLFVNYPVITQIKSETNHFIVIYGFKNKKLLVADPLYSHIRWVRVKDFVKIWIPYVFAIKEVDEKLNCISQNQNYKHYTSIILALLKNKGFFVSSWLLTASAYVISIIYTSMYTIFFDTIVQNGLATMIPYFVVYFILICLLQLIVNLINTKITIKLNNRIDLGLTQNLLRSFFLKDFQILDKYKIGELVTRFRNVTQIRNYYIYLIQVFPLDLLIILISFNILLKQNEFLTILLLIPLLVFFTIIYLSHNIMKKNSLELNKCNEDFNTALIEVIDNVETIKNYNVSGKFEKQITNKFNKLLITIEKFVSFDILQKNIRNTVFSIFTIMLFGLGSYLIINKALSQGMLLIFHSIALMVFNPVQKMGEVQATLEQGKTAQKKYDDLVNTNTYVTDGTLKLSKIDEIKFNSVSFQYDSNHLVFEGLDIILKHDSTIAIIGDSGTGKSTFGKILACYYTYLKGDILINGKNYNEYSKESIQNRILYIPPKTAVFNGTILDNILLGRNADLCKIEQAANWIGFSETINKLPKGYDTIIGEKGVQLSTGQLQLMNILRATICSYDVIIFDEVTSGLDKRHQEKVFEYMTSYGNIKVFITHQEEIYKKCDKIYKIQNLKLEEMV